MCTGQQMDLVDIDKVLDDLELDEDQYNVDQARGKIPISHGQDLNEQNPTKATQSIIQPQQQPPEQQLQQQMKTFVNVSNVFQSLNEYVNVEIESFKNDDGGNNTLETIGTHSQINDKRKYVMSAKSTVEQQDDGPTAAAAEEDDASSEQTSTYSSPSSVDVVKPKFIYENSTTSGSVMTASASSIASSTSSSGASSSLAAAPPSSSVASTSSSSSSSPPSSLSHRPSDSISPMQRENSATQLQHDSNDDDDDEVDIDVSDKPTPSHYSVNNANCPSATDTVPPQTIDIVDRLDPIQLSSISSLCFNEQNSMTPSFSDEIIIVDETTTSSMSSLNLNSNLLTTEMTKDDLLIEQQQQQCGLNHPQKHLNGNNINKSQLNAQQQSLIIEQHQHHQKPIGFESTMDDVSDTELESYLQELEMETSTTNQTIYSDIQPNSESNPSTNLIDDEQRDGSINQQSSDMFVVETDMVGKNQQNADSFSQASTVEYADVRFQTDFEHLPMTNELNPMIECFVDGTNENDLIDANLDEQQIDGVDDGKEEGEHNRKNDEPSTKLQRPNSLDIQSSTSILLTENLSALTPSEHIDQSAIVSPSIQQQGNDQHLSATITTTAAATPLSSSSSSDSDFPNHTTNPSATISAAAGAVVDPAASASNAIGTQLGKVQPYWIPDNVTNCCMQCNVKFSIIKRRHHCRACGQVLCSACCSLKAKLSYMADAEARICVQCDMLLNQYDTNEQQQQRLVSNDAVETYGNVAATLPTATSTVATTIVSTITSTTTTTTIISSSSSSSHPNPNNPMEYCSVIPPHQQISAQPLQQLHQPISVMVPVGVLKREGQPKQNRKEKTVIFSDGIRPGCDLAELDTNWDHRSVSSTTGTTSLSSSTSIKELPLTNRRVQTPPGPEDLQHQQKRLKNKIGLPTIDPSNKSFIPETDDGIPPIYIETNKTEYRFIDTYNGPQLIARLQNETLKFAIQRNFYVFVKIVKLSCCINKMVINFTTQGMHYVGQDELMILLEMDETKRIPKDIFLHLNEIYRNADKGTTISELGFSMPNTTTNFLGTKEHGGLLYIRPTFQCLQNLILPENPFLIGVLIHRWEVPWAKVFPLRLMLRLGAMYRYYPCPHVSVRERDSSYAEIAQTIINFLADFRAYTYTLPTIRGMFIHMEDRTTRVEIPKNRYDQIMKAITNSSEHILALGANFSQKADGHLVCIQNTESNCSETHSYSTQAVNIQGRPRKVTGASFLVLNGALKTASGLSGKCSIVEDGLMVQILPTKMVAIRKALKEMKNIDIICGPNEGDASQTEVVSIQWTDDDLEFNIGVVSPIDNKSMAGIPSIRVHRGTEYTNSNHILRWTEVFIIQSDEDACHVKDPIDMSKLSECIAQSASTALVSYLDLLAASSLTKIGLRTTIHQDNVCYEAGSQQTKLGPLYMNALDNELIPMLHRQATNLQLDTPITIELIFHILDE